MRDRSGLDDQELGVAAPRAPVGPGLVPDPGVMKQLRIPRELDPVAVGGLRTTMRPTGRSAAQKSRLRLRASGQRSAHSREPSSRRTSGHGVASGGGTARPLHLVQLEGSPVGQLEQDLGVEELESERDVLRGDDGTRSPPAVRSTETARPPSTSSSVAPPDAVASPRERGRALVDSSTPPTDRSRRARGTRTRPVHPAPVAGVRKEQLPPAPIGGCPRLFVEVAGDRRRRAEGRTPEQLPSAPKLDEIEDLAAVAGVGPDDDVGRAKDDHDRGGGAVELRTTTSGSPATTTSRGSPPSSWSRSASTPAAPSSESGILIVVSGGRRYSASGMSS